MSWVAVGSAVVGVVGASMQAKAGEKGAAGQVAASRYATDEQRRQFDQTREDMMPWLNAGQNALQQQQNFLAGDWSGFEKSPAYAYAFQQGNQALDRSAAARGGFMGGGADADRIALGQGMALQNSNNYFNQLAGIAGTGQTTAGQLGQFGQAFGQQAGVNAMNGANAQASSYANTANAWGNGMNQVLNAYGMWQGRQG